MVQHINEAKTNMYRAAKTHRMPYFFFRLFSAKEPLIRRVVQHVNLIKDTHVQGREHPYDV